MSNFYIMNGKNRSGKTSFARACQDWNPDIIVSSSVDIVKSCAKMLGWTGTKDSKSRKFLSDLKDLATEYSDHSILYAKELSQHETVFYDSREPDEIARLEKEILNALSVYVDNPNLETYETGNHADANVTNHQYDIYLINDGSFEDWKRKAKIFTDRIVITFDKDREVINMDTNKYETNDYITISDANSMIPHRTIKYDDRKECLSDIVNGLIERMMS